MNAKSTSSVSRPSPVTLVFPSSMTEAIDFSQQAKSRGERVLAASSIRSDETARYFNEWVYLPLIYDQHFDSQFTAVVHDHGITHFYTAHPVVYNRVKKLVAQEALPVSIVSQSPIEALDDHYHQILERCVGLQAFIRAIDRSSE